MTLLYAKPARSEPQASGVGRQARRARSEPQASGVERYAGVPLAQVIRAAEDGVES